MKYLPAVCLVASTLAVMTSLVSAQFAPDVPMQRGISVELPVINNAVAIPDADEEDALVVTVTHDLNLYPGGQSDESLCVSGESQKCSLHENRRSGVHQG